MQLISLVAILLPALVSSLPTSEVTKRTTTLSPSLRVPVDNSAPNLVYGNSPEITIWNKPHGNRRILLAFDVPTASSSCKLVFLAPTSPPASSTGQISVNAWGLAEDVVFNDSWNTKPSHTVLAGNGVIQLSQLGASYVAFSQEAPCSGRVNYELEMVTAGGSIGFTSGPGLGFFLEV